MEFYRDNEVSRLFSKVGGAQSLEISTESAFIWLSVRFLWQKTFLFDFLQEKGEESLKTRFLSEFTREFTKIWQKVEQHLEFWWELEPLLSPRSVTLVYVEELNSMNESYITDGGSTHPLWKSELQFHSLKPFLLKKFSRWLLIKQIFMEKEKEQSNYKKKPITERMWGKKILNRFSGFAKGQWNY
jgi:hypothetical protein